MEKNELKEKILKITAVDCDYCGIDREETMTYNPKTELWECPNGHSDSMPELVQKDMIEMFQNILTCLK